MYFIPDIIGIHGYCQGFGWTEIIISPARQHPTGAAGGRPPPKDLPWGLDVGFWKEDREEPTHDANSAGSWMGRPDCDQAKCLFLGNPNYHPAIKRALPVRPFLDELTEAMPDNA